LTIKKLFLHIFFRKMNFFKMTPWSNYPSIDENDNIVIRNPRTINICELKCVDINIGLILLNLPPNHIVKIINPKKSYIILTSFWLPSSNDLSLTIISKQNIQIKAEEPLCHLQLLPILYFLTGKEDVFI
jgi:hypothetical protein